MSHTDKELYEFANFRLDVSERLLLSKSGKRVQLSDKAFETLCALVRRAGQLVGKDELLAIVWADATVEENNLDKSISLLRQALGEQRKGRGKFIETVRGRGYRFVAEVRRIELTEPAATNEFEKPESFVTAGGLNEAEIQALNSKRQNSQSNQAAAPENLTQVRGSGNVFPLVEWRRKSRNESNSAEVLNADTESGKKQDAPARSPKKEEFRLRQWLPLAITLVLILGAAVFAVKSYMLREKTGDTNSAAAPFQTFKIKRLSETGETKRTTVSADGKFIAYADTKNAVWLKNMATGGMLKVLPESETIKREAIAVSPDNNYIYFGANYEDKKSEILKMPIFGGDTQVVAQDPWSNAALSADGKFFSYTRGNMETSESFLLVASTDGAGERAIAVRQGGKWFGNWSQSTAWSPDGSHIAAISETSALKYTSITIVRVADGEQIVLPEIRENVRLDDIVWLPDGDNLLVTSIEASVAQIYRYTISTGTLKRITHDLSEYIGLSVTADGKTLVTSQWENICNLWVLPANGDKTQAQQITTGRNLITDVSGITWTPDGKILYATNASGRWDIWQVGADGTNQRQLTNNCAGNDSCAQPFASPDGRFIVFHARRGEVANIWRMDADGSNPTQLSNDYGTAPTITPDGRLVIYTRKLPQDVSTLWRVPLDGSEPPQPLNNLSLAERAVVSPNGKRIAFGYNRVIEKRRWHTCIAPIDAAAPEKCFGNSRSYPRWASDNKAFYYLDPDYSGIWKQLFDRKRAMFLEFQGERLNNFAFSPDGRQLVVSRSKPRQDIVALTNEPEN
ncbi:MAG: winged helix-turn-helix domain-containing protein [Acidobacteriota bacterium]|nr:winged helix-turn-helix domain-containing protein [Acidobacteriota bacterium]